jgi:hypothetical protein
VNGAFEGDLIRPLGLVTLNFGYAEYELDIGKATRSHPPTRQPATKANLRIARRPALRRTAPSVPARHGLESSTRPRAPVFSGLPTLQPLIQL